MRLQASLAAVAVGVLTSSVNAQLTPSRTYYGLGRSMPMTVNLSSDGEASIKLLKPVTADEIASADVVEGEVDLAGLFPRLWDTSQPELLYAQLMIGGDKVGPAVVLQPMVSPQYASAAGSGLPRFTPMGDVYSGVRAYVDKHVVMETSEGKIEFRMRPDEAPNTVFTHMHLVGGGFYTDVVFHRVVPSVNTPEGPAPFVIQAGDPLGQGNGGPGFMIDLEPSQLPHDFGVLSMARTNDPNTNGSQFFVCLSRPGTSFLDGRYTAFGEAVSGADVIDAIASTPLTEGANSQTPVDPPVIERAYLVDAPPYGEGPAPVKRPGEGSPR